VAPDPEAVRKFLLRQVADGATDVAQSASQQFGFSSQTANAYLRELAREGLIVASGRTRARTYALQSDRRFKFYSLEGLQEDNVWRELAIPQLGGLPAEVRKICQYGFTEMLNNAVDHSEGTRVGCLVETSALGVQMVVQDDGVGIFRKIRESFRLSDDRDAILQLSKGKLTTDPASHTGQGIFFSSRVFDEFAIVSHALSFLHLPNNSDWLVEDTDDREGTMVNMKIDIDSPRTLNQVFDQYSSKDGDYAFTVTHIPVGLVRHGEENLISRSQAKRLLTRIEAFREVVLDFAGVEAIGQAFADEVFRVFTREHPEIQVRFVNAAPDVEKMIRRATSPGTAPAD
jgi:anti-sigma regulatory factor (Ser/Thr protein kinase)